MSKNILSSIGNQISGIAVWDPKDRYPTVSAGTKDPAQVALETGDQIGTLNGNWIRIRNYVNMLRSMIDAGLAAIQDASETVPGKINLTLQLLSGVKQFVDGAWLGKNNARTGQLKFFRENNTSVTVLEASHTGNRAIYFPDKDGTLATIGDINAAGTALDTHKSGADHDGRYYTETEVNAKLATHNLAETNDHDGRYYTEAEIDAKLAVKKPTWTLIFHFIEGIPYCGTIRVDGTVAPSLPYSGRVKAISLVQKSGHTPPPVLGIGASVIEFGAGAKIGVKNDGTNIIMVFINGSVANLGIGATDADIAFVTLYGEFG